MFTENDRAMITSAIITETQRRLKLSAAAEQGRCHALLDALSRIVFEQDKEFVARSARLVLDLLSEGIAAVSHDALVQGRYEYAIRCLRTILV